MSKNDAGAGDAAGGRVRRQRGIPQDVHGEREPLTDRQRSVLNYIEETVSTRGYPPSVREICAAVGLTSPSTVHAHLSRLQRMGYLKRENTKPRAMEVRFDPQSGVTGDRAPVRHVPLLGDVAAGTGVLANQDVEELMPLPQQFTGDGDLFMLRVRGESMIRAGIFDRDYVVVRRQPTADPGDIIVAGIPGNEATVKIYRPAGAEGVLEPANPDLSPMTFAADDVTVYGRVVTVLRKL